ncbi:MAG: hypothetical protein H0V12_02710 [Chloroflexi bacterium]|nr:hypothetical protein [Chloroflexota bacterium]
MTLWLQVRGAPTILVAIVITLVGLALPGSSVAVTPSPAGATLAAALFLALAVPIAVGWGCARGDPQLESVSGRPIYAFDLLLAVLAVGITCGAALTMQQAGVTLTGSVAARDVLVYLALMLLAYPLTGWRVATTIPAVYLLGVAVFGRGDDIYHPAGWAWIASDGGDPTSWVATVALLAVGVGAYLTIRPRMSGLPADD